MSTAWKLYWALVALTLVIYFTMILWSLPVVSAAAGGLVPFDMRPSGYSFDAAHAFLSAITPDGSAFYRGTQQMLDIAYPTLLAVVLVIALWNLAKRLPVWARYVLIALPIIGSVADHLENAAVSGMLQAGPDALTAEMVAIASRWTLIKSGATSVAMLVLLGFLAMLLVRKFLARNTNK